MWSAPRPKPVYDAGREACVEFLVELTARYERQVTRLEVRIERLEEKLRESSQNSSWPPSSDPPAKPPGPARPGRRRGRSTDRLSKGRHQGELRKPTDAPLSKVILHMQGAKKGLIVNSRNLCAASSNANVELDAHNGGSSACARWCRRGAAAGRGGTETRPALGPLPARLRQ
ncbi:MAG TPA: DUF6444 domain-containing protein [Solirubrobacterales bacterium]|nr:DUF6444 domain-containing protein [Solirubrobacterales bacterium]